MHQTLRDLIKTNRNTKPSIALKTTVKRRIRAVMDSRRLKDGKSILTGLVLDNSLKATKIITYLAGN